MVKQTYISLMRTQTQQKSIQMSVLSFNGDLMWDLKAKKCLKIEVKEERLPKQAQVR